MVPFVQRRAWFTITSLSAFVASLTGERSCGGIFDTKAPWCGTPARRRRESPRRPPNSGPCWRWWCRGGAARTRSAAWRSRCLVGPAVERFSHVGMHSSATCRRISWDTREPARRSVKRRQRSERGFFRLPGALSRLCRRLDRSTRWDSIHASLWWRFSSIPVDCRAAACLAAQPWRSQRILFPDFQVSLVAQLHKRRRDKATAALPKFRGRKGVCCKNKKRLG